MTTITVPLTLSYPPACLTPRDEAAPLVARAVEAAALAVARACAVGDHTRATQIVAIVESLAGAPAGEEVRP